MHYCLNLVADRAGVPGCVLIRAAEPLTGNLEPGSCRGPGRLCRSLGLDTGQSGSSLFAAGSELYLREGRAPERIGTSPRVGVTLAADEALRFFDPESPAVSAFRAFRPRLKPAPERSPTARR